MKYSYLLIPMALILAVGLDVTNAGAESRLEKAVTRLVETNNSRELDRMDDSEIEDVAGEVAEAADDIDNHDDPSFRKHILKEWGRGKSSRRHIEKCPYCNDVATKVADRTGMEPPQNGIPRCFVINGAPYGALPGGQLVRLHPQTGRQISGPEGFIWFGGGQYVGVGYNGVRIRAKPCQ